MSTKNTAARWAVLFVVGAGAALAQWGANQGYSRRATMTGSRGDRGKCTIEVEVDGVADVEIRGDQGYLRTLQGQPATWRRFECSDPLPRNPADFKFSGIDGRGRQTLVQDPRSGGRGAVVRIEDSKGGREGYTFDIEWTGNFNSGNQGNGNWNQGNNGSGGGWRDNNNNNSRNADFAVQNCRDAVRNRVRDMGYRDIDVTRAAFEDNRGRRDFIRGNVSARQGNGNYREDLAFTCAVDFNSGQIRNVDVNRLGNSSNSGTDPYYLGGSNPGSNSSPGYGNRWGSGQAVRACREAAADRLNGMGYRNANVYEALPDQGRSDWVLGKATGQRGGRGQEFVFNCQVDSNAGRIVSIDVRER